MDRDAGGQESPGFAEQQLPYAVSEKQDGVDVDWDYDEGAGPQHVVLDVRDRSQSGQTHIQTAVAMPTADLQAMTQQFIKEQKVAQLPGASDMVVNSAPYQSHVIEASSGEVVEEGVRVGF